MKLKIRESSWSGWSENYKPREVTNIYDIELNKKYVIDKNEELVFTIEKINDDGIIIKTTEPFSDSKKGIDLFTNKTEFTVSFDEEIELTTPTMDFGCIFYLQLVNQ